MPFEDDDAPLEGPNSPSMKALKIKGQQSNFAAKTELNKEIKNNFEEKANSVFEKKEDYKNRSFQLSRQFKKILSDKTLASNKLEISDSSEKELIGKLLQLAIDINSDPNEDDDLGTLGLIILLLKTSLIQRDIINELDYKNHLLDKRLIVLEKK